MKYHICREKMQLSRAKPGNPASITYKNGQEYVSTCIFFYTVTISIAIIEHYDSHITAFVFLVPYKLCCITVRLPHYCSFVIGTISVVVFYCITRN